MDIVPETFAAFVPDKTVPEFKFSLDGPLATSVQNKVATNVVAAIKRKCTTEELLLVLKVSQSFNQMSYLPVRR